MGYKVISLKIGQRIQIGRDIEVLISDYDSGKVDVAVKAPKEISIDRLPTKAEEAFKNVNSDADRSRFRPGKSFSNRHKV